MIYWKLIVTDLSNEVSCHNKNFVPCSMRFSCSGMIQGKINLLEENEIGFQWQGITQSFAMLLLQYNWLLTCICCKIHLTTGV